VQVLHEWIDFKSGYPGLAILITLFEPLKCLVLLAEPRIDNGKAVGVNKSALRDLLELGKYFSMLHKALQSLLI
jgi:hypothetical protein